MVTDHLSDLTLLLSTHAESIVRKGKEMVKLTSCSTKFNNSIIVGILTKVPLKFPDNNKKTNKGLSPIVLSSAALARIQQAPSAMNIFNYFNQIL